MANGKDWIPRSEEKLVEMMAFWQKKLADKQAQTLYEWPEIACTALIAAISYYLDARAAYTAAPTTANRVERDDLKNAAIDAVRKFARERIRNNPLMNDGQKKQMGITVQDNEPSPIPVPETGPESEAMISAREPGVVKVKYLGAKPYGVDRIEIAWLVSHTAVDSPDQLTSNQTFPRNPWEHTFGHDERGMKMYYSLRYLTKTGASHWSDVREVVIP
ncbi:MAG: hypothetical protein LBD07_04000 [Spirochaetaceae bacterium]|jgi:hypothetical protein|nr:hypothetical protein [Spirochaetaceae bacterium]